jgi:hypothetical protein
MRSAGLDRSDAPATKLEAVIGQARAGRRPGRPFARGAAVDRHGRAYPPWALSPEQQKLGKTYQSSRRSCEKPLVRSRRELGEAHSKGVHRRGEATVVERVGRIAGGVVPRIAIEGGVGHHGGSVATAPE